MEGLNLIPIERRPYPRHIKEPLMRGFWVVIVIAIFIVTFSVSVMFFSSVSRGWNKPGQPVVAMQIEQNKIWVKKPLSKCNEDWDKKNISLDKYLNGLGVEVFDKIKTDELPLKVDQDCQACSCLSGELLYLYIYEEALDDLPEFSETIPPDVKFQ